MATTATRTNYWFIKTTSTTSPVFNFKFVLQIFIDSTLVATLTQPKNNAGSAHFNIERVVKNYINVSNKRAQTTTPTPISYNDIHLIPRNKPNDNSSGTVFDYAWSDNEGTIRTVSLSFFEDYSTTSNGTITRNTSGQANIPIVYINLANDWHDQLTFDVSKFVFSATSTSSNFLTKLPLVDYNNNRLYHEVGPGEFRTLAAFNSTDLGSVTSYIMYKFYDTLPDATYSNHRASTVSVNAGNAVSGVANDSKALKFYAAGYENVSKIKIVNTGGAELLPTDKYYTINSIKATGIVGSAVPATTLRQGDFALIVSAGTTDFTLVGAANNSPGTAFYATGVPTGTGTVQTVSYTSNSQIYNFKISDDCNKFTSTRTTRTIAWKNKYGTWDYHLFDTKISDSDSTKRSIEYTRNAGTWNATDYDTNTYERGQVQKVEGTHNFTANTRFLDEAYNDYFKGLMMSNDIQMIIKKEVIAGQIDGTSTQNEYVLPLIMTSNSMRYKTVINDQLIQYSFNFQLSHKLKEQI